MPQITFPSEARIIETQFEFWSPGRIVHRLRDGQLTTPLNRATPRLRGTTSLGLYGIKYITNSINVSKVELFVSELSIPENYSFIPWGGDAPQFPIPDETFRATVTTVTSGVIVLNRTASTATLSPGQWLQVDPAFNEFTGRTLLIRTVSGTPATPIITTIPSLNFTALTPLQPATHIPIRLLNPEDSGISIGRTSSWGGEVTFNWEEFIV